MSDLINWWQVACLCLCSELPGQQPTELFRGQLSDAVHLALVRPEEERKRLFIICSSKKRKLDWAAIAKLSDLPDFPVQI